MVSAGARRLCRWWSHPSAEMFVPLCQSFVSFSFFYLNQISPSSPFFLSFFPIILLFYFFRFLPLLLLRVLRVSFSGWRRRMSIITRLLSLSFSLCRLRIAIILSLIQGNGRRFLVYPRRPQKITITTHRKKKRNSTTRREIAGRIR